MRQGVVRRGVVSQVVRRGVVRRGMVRQVVSQVVRRGADLDDTVEFATFAAASNEKYFFVT